MKFCVASFGLDCFMSKKQLEHVSSDPSVFGLFSLLCSVLKMVHVVFFLLVQIISLCLALVQVPHFSKKGFQMWFKVVFRKLPLLKVGKLCLPQNVLCLNLLKFVRRCLERLRWFGSASACCGMLQFVCKRGRLQFVCLLGFAMFCAVQRDSECFGVVMVCLGSIQILGLYSVFLNL